MFGILKWLHEREDAIELVERLTRIEEKQVFQGIRLDTIADLILKMILGILGIVGVAVLRLVMKNGKSQDV